MWVSEFENDPTLGVMEDCYNNLKAKSIYRTPLRPPHFLLIDPTHRRLLVRGAARTAAA